MMAQIFLSLFYLSRFFNKTSFFLFKMKFFASQFFSKKLSKKNCFSSVLRQGPFFFAAKWLQLVYTHKSKKKNSETNIVGDCGLEIEASFKKPYGTHLLDS